MDGAPPRYLVFAAGTVRADWTAWRYRPCEQKLAGLLAYLACTAPQPQPREKLSALLWGSHFDAQAKQNMRQALYRLRKVLGEDALESDGEVVAQCGGGPMRRRPVRDPGP